MVPDSLVHQRNQDPSPNAGGVRKEGGKKLRALRGRLQVKPFVRSIPTMTSTSLMRSVQIRLILAKERTTVVVQRLGEHGVHC